MGRVDGMRKQYLLRLQDHLRSLKRRRAGQERAAKRCGWTNERIKAMFDLTQHILFTEQWIKEVKKWS